MIICNIVYTNFDNTLLFDSTFLLLSCTTTKYPIIELVTLNIFFFIYNSSLFVRSLLTISDEHVFITIRMCYIIIYYYYYC